MADLGAKILKSVFFRPWVGENYKAGGLNGKRILVLGESCYCDTCPDECGGFDRFDYISENPDDEKWQKGCRNRIPEVVTRFLDYKSGNVPFQYYMRGFDKFTHIFMGHKCTVEETQNFWKSFVFYNYVQTALDKARVPPKDWEWKTGEKPFSEVLAEYNPDVIIVWGKRLWENMIKTSLIDHSFPNRWGDGLRYYNNGTRDIPAYACYHPSSLSLSDEDSGYFKRLLEKAPASSK